MDFNDIPLFPRSGYVVDISFTYMEEWVDSQIREGLDLNPDFQRGHVWTTEQRSRFVEYILRGGEGGKLLSFNHPGWSGKNGSTREGPYQILDGLQRLTSVRMFMKNELPAFGRTLSEYTGRTHLRFHAGLKWRIFELQTREEVLQYYLDMNAGGTPHAESEIKRVRRLLQKEKAHGRTT